MSGDVQLGDVAELAPDPAPNAGLLELVSATETFSAPLHRQEALRLIGRAVHVVTPSLPASSIA
jgi:hypothetical protein